MYNSTLNSSEIKLNGEDLIELEMKQANSRNHERFTRQKRRRRRTRSITEKNDKTVGPQSQTSKPNFEIIYRISKG